MQDAGNFLLSVAQPSNAADKSLALLWLYRFVVLGAPGKSGMEHSMQVLMLVRTLCVLNGHPLVYLLAQRWGLCGISSTCILTVSLLAQL